MLRKPTQTPRKAVRRTPRIPVFAFICSEGETAGARAKAMRDEIDSGKVKGVKSGDVSIQVASYGSGAYFPNAHEAVLKKATLIIPAHKEAHRVVRNQYDLWDDIGKKTRASKRVIPFEEIKDPNNSYVKRKMRESVRRRKQAMAKE